MFASSADYVAFVRDQLDGLGGVSGSRFFGGTALSSDGVQFAMVMGDVLYFAVDERTRPRYEAAGSRCFAYETRKGPVQVSRYYEVPADVLDDGDALQAWARESITAARRRLRE